MIVPTSISLSAIGTAEESPLHAFNGNCDAPIEFWGLRIRGASTVPAFNKFSCAQPTGDDLLDVMNYFSYVIGHTWSASDLVDGFTYQQTDALDESTLQATGATVDVDTFPGGFLPGPPIWNNNEGYTYVFPPDPSISSTAGADWDASGTRTAITGALDGVDWSALWAQVPGTIGNFIFDRVALAFDASGTLPFGGTASGDLVGYPGPSDGPHLILSGTSGQLVGAQSSTDDDGISLIRSQIQIRNFRGAPIPYVIIETAGAAGNVIVPGLPGTTNTIFYTLELGDIDGYARKVSEGVWDHDMQIIQLPDPAMDGPQHITAGIGTRVRNGTIVQMLVGITWEDYMLSQFGVDWPSHVY